MSSVNLGPSRGPQVSRAAPAVETRTENTPQTQAPAETNAPARPLQVRDEFVQGPAQGAGGMKALAAEAPEAAPVDQRPVRTLDPADKALPRDLEPYKEQLDTITRDLERKYDVTQPEQKAMAYAEALVGALKAGVPIWRAADAAKYAVENMQGPTAQSPGKDQFAQGDQPEGTPAVA